MIKDILDKLNEKRKEYKILKFFEFFLAIGLTIVGSVSIVKILQFLFEKTSISIFDCLLLNFFFSFIYSNVSNIFLNMMDNKIKDVLLEMEMFEKEYEQEIVKNEEFKKVLERRFGNLSKVSQKKILKYVREICLSRINENDNQKIVLGDSEQAFINSMILNEDFDEKNNCLVRKK